MYRLIKLTILLHLLPGINGAVTLNCGATSPTLPQSVTCSCKNVGGNGVEWSRDTTWLSNCFFSVGCSQNPIGYTFSVNQTEQTSIMTVNPYNYSDCQQFTCKDISDTSIQQSQTPSTIDFDSTMPSGIAEPVSNNTSGNIFITTSCISGYTDLIVTWYIVVDGTKKQYTPDQDIVIRQINTTTCIACNSESSATITLGFKHKEAVDNEASEGYFQLELHHPEYPSDKLVRKTTNVYKVADFNENTGCNQCFIKICWPEWACGLLIFVVALVFCSICCCCIAWVCAKRQRGVKEKSTLTDETYRADFHVTLKTLEEQICIIQRNENVKEVLDEQEKLNNAINEYKIFSKEVFHEIEGVIVFANPASSAKEVTEININQTWTKATRSKTCQTSVDWNLFRYIIKQIDSLSQAIMDDKDILNTKIRMYRKVETLIELMEDVQMLLSSEDHPMDNVSVETEVTKKRNTALRKKLIELEELMNIIKHNKELNEISHKLKKISKATSEYLNTRSRSHTDIDTSINECKEELKTPTKDLHKDVQNIVKKMEEIQKHLSKEKKAATEQIGTNCWNDSK